MALQWRRREPLLDSVSLLLLRVRGWNPLHEEEGGDETGVVVAPGEEQDGAVP